MKSFNELDLSAELASAIDKLGFTTPTQIQYESIPHIVQGKDVMGESSTGSGKTLAFGCGIIEHVQPKKGLQAIILTPTRELADQVSGGIKDLASKKKLSIATIYGGVSYNPQINALKKAEVVVATPGRLLDHMEQRTINLSKVHMVVLDEADRMLDMGFIDDVKRIIKQCPKERQTLFFSATLSTQIRSLANQFMNNPVEVLAGKQVDPSKLEQVYYNVQPNNKISLLVHLLNEEESGLVIVFCNSRKTTDFVSKNLSLNNIEAIPIHGGLTQNKRSKTLETFNDGKVHVLVCTDVAARGLHINNVSHVYNYEIPNDPRDYVHRIGRTARAGESGKVINLLCKYDHDNYSRVRRDYRDYNIENVPVPDHKQVQTVRPQGRPSGGRFNNRRSSGSRGPQRGSRGPRRSGPRSYGESRGQRSERPRRNYARR